MFIQTNLGPTKQGYNSVENTEKTQLNRFVERTLTVVFSAFGKSEIHTFFQFVTKSVPRRATSQNPFNFHLKLKL